MPTLVEVEVPASSQNDVSAASETILLDETIVMDVANEKASSTLTSQSGSRETISQEHPSPNRATINMSGGNDDQDVTFDDSATILSQTLLSHHDESRRVDADESQVDDNSSMGVPPTPKNPTNDVANQAECAVRRPQQELYRSKYKGYVKKTIYDFSKRYPEKLRNYRTMSLEEKETEQRNVLSLLACLGINKTSRHNNSQILHQSQSQKPRGNENESPNLDDRRRLLDDTMSPMLSPEYHGRDNSPCVKNDYPVAQNSFRSDADETVLPDKSELLFSPEVSPIQNKDSQQKELSSSSDFPVNMSSESVELVRAEKSVSSHNRSFDSPEKHLRTNPNKRHASSSGKRGADLARHRYNQGTTPPCYAENDYDFGMALSSRMERLSLSPESSGPQDFFVASQSPISSRLTYGSSDDEKSSDDDRGRISLDYRRSSVRRSDDTIGTFDTSSRRANNDNNKEKRRALREMPVNVGLKEGATFHLGKLDIKRTEGYRQKNRKTEKDQPRRRLVNFPDPFIKYSTRQRNGLTGIFQWINQSECDNRKRGNGVPTAAALFSMTHEQIVDFNLKLLLDDSRDGERLRTVDRPPATPFQGKTIIIARTKEDTIKWENALREGTGCSVLNHATMPLSERIRASLAEKATLYDVIISTYDAMKSPDVAVPVNESGRVILKDEGAKTGWYSSRSASQHDTVAQICKQLSVLHRVSFTRIVYIDLLGRKCFLAKGGTARASAAVALRGASRLVFFCQSEADGVSALIALRKSDRQAIRSLSAVLHLGQGEDDHDEEDEENEILENYVLDLKDMC